MTTQVIKASEFKAKCLQLMDQVQHTGQEIIITKNGKPVCKLAPIKIKPKTLFGAHKDQIEILGDIVSPLHAQWEAMQ